MEGLHGHFGNVCFVCVTAAQSFKSLQLSQDLFFTKVPSGAQVSVTAGCHRATIELGHTFVLGHFWDFAAVARYTRSTIELGAQLLS